MHPNPKLLFSLYLNLFLLVITSQVQNTVFDFNDMLFIGIFLFN